MLTKIAFVVDPHMSDVAPESRLDNWTETILTKLKFIIDHCNDNDVATIVLLGDLFHRKNPNLNSHDTNSRLISLFKSFKGKIYSTIGNHDISMTATNLHKQPIFVLEQAGVINLIAYPYSGAIVVVNDVLIAGLGYSDANENFSSSYFEINEMAANLISSGHVKFSILCLHQTLLPDGDTFFGDYLNFADVKDMVFDMFACGHFHPGYTPHTIKAHEKIYLNPGSISRGSLGVHNIGRIPQFAIMHFEDDKRKMEYVTIPHQPADVVFDLKKVEKALLKAEEISSFVNTIKDIVDQKYDISSVQGLKELLFTLGVEKDVIDFSGPYLEEAQEELKHL